MTALLGRHQRNREPCIFCDHADHWGPRETRIWLIGGGITRDDGDHGDSSRTLGRIVVALEKAGIEFLNGEHRGVRLTKA